MPQLGVGNEMSIGKQCRPNPRPQSDHQYNTLLIFPRPKTHFSETGHIGIICHCATATSRTTKELAGVGPDPSRIDIRRRIRYSPANYGRKPATNRPIPNKVRGNSRDRISNRCRCRWLRRKQPKTVREQRAISRIYGCSLDARATNIKTERFHQ